MLKKHLAPALLLCAGLLLSACGAAEAPGSAQSLSADLDGDGQEETVEYSVFSPEGAPGSRCSPVSYTHLDVYKRQLSVWPRS